MNYMNHKHLLVGDTVLLTGGEWDYDHRAKDTENTVTLVTDFRAKLQNHLRGAYEVTENWPCLLVARGGKRVKSILGSSYGEFRVEFEDGSRSRWLERYGWKEPGTKMTNDKFLSSQENGGALWTQIYPLTTPEQSEDEKIEAALATIKSNHGFCDEFDDAVKQAKELPLRERLEIVANAKGRPELITELDELLNPTTKPVIDVHTLEVDGGFLLVQHRTTGSIYIFQWDENEGYWPWSNDMFAEPQYDSHTSGDCPRFLDKGTWQLLDSGVLKGTITPEPVKVPEIGRWIEALMFDGETRTFEVTMNEEVTREKEVRLADAHIPKRWYCIHTSGIIGQGGARDFWVKSWKYVDAPRKIKWPAGATVLSSTSNKVYVIERDVYEGDTCFNGDYDVTMFQRVEIKVVE